MVAGGGLACIRSLLDSRCAGGGIGRTFPAGAAGACHRYCARCIFHCHDPDPTLAPRSKPAYPALAACACRRGDRLHHGHRLIDRAAQRPGLHFLWADEGGFSFDRSRQLACPDDQQSRDLPPAALLQGLIVGASVMGGSFAGKAIVQRMAFTPSNICSTPCSCVPGFPSHGRHLTDPCR